MRNSWKFHLIIIWTLLTTTLVVLSMPSRSTSSSEGSAPISEEIFPRHELNRRDSYQLCGIKLANTLHSVCRGFYNPMFKKNDQEARSPPVKPQEDTGFPFRTKMTATSFVSGGALRRRTRGVYDECCIKGCTFGELSSYCGSPPNNA